MVTFVHDHIFITDENLVYTTASFPYSVWKRYLMVFDSLVVIGRKNQNASGIKEFAVSSGPKVRFSFIKSYNKARNLYLKPRSIYLELENQLIKSPHVIIRLPSRLGIIAYTICKKHKIPYLVEVVGSWSDVIKFNSFGFEFPFLVYYDYLMKRCIKKASYVIYVTNYYLQKVYPTLGLQISISDVQIGLLSNIELNIRLNKIKTWKKDKQYRIGMIGNLSMKYKGFDVALKAVKKLLFSGFDVELNLVGGGDSTWILQLADYLQIRKQVKVVGSLESGKKIFDFLDKMDLFYQVSYVDSMPRSLLEAMSRGCVCLGSNVGDIPYLLDHEEIIEVGNSSELFNKTKSILEDPSIALSHVLRNLSLVKSYSEESLSQKRIEFLHDFRRDC